jgi:hypothetical protein
MHSVPKIIHVLILFVTCTYCYKKSKFFYDRRSVGQSSMVSSLHLGSKTTFLLLPDTCVHILFLSVKLLLVFPSTVIPGFSLLEIHEQDFYSLLDVYVFRNGSFSSTKEGLVSFRVSLRLTFNRQSIRLGARSLDDHDQSFFCNYTLAVIVLM